MVSPLDFSGLGGMSRAELKAKKQAEEEKKKQMQTMMDMVGVLVTELVILSALGLYKTLLNPTILEYVHL